MKKIKVITVLTVCAVMSACVPTYTLINPGVQAYGNFRITADNPWNLAPPAVSPGNRRDSHTWTQDGLLLDRLIIIPAVHDGQALFRSRQQSAALPVFRADMLPNEIEELLESSVTKYFGEGSSSVDTKNLRPHVFTDRNGFLFDIEMAVTESPDYRGMAGAFIADDKLYMIIFIAATPHYYEKHIASAEAVIKSATLAQPTIRVN